MSMLISRSSVMAEIKRLRKENAQLVEGGRAGAAASLIVSELYKLAAERGLEQGVSGEQFVGWWRKQLQPNKEKK